MVRGMENKFLFFVCVVAILFGAIGITWALSPGQVPNPGHGVDSIGAPVGCQAGQTLTWSGSEWECVSAAAPVAGGTTCISHEFGPYTVNTWEAVDIPTECIDNVCVYILERDRLGAIQTEMRYMYMGADGHWARTASTTALTKVNGDSNDWRIISMSRDGSVTAALDDDQDVEDDVDKLSVYTRKTNYVNTLRICY